jgi:ferredoxin
LRTGPAPALWGGSSGGILEGEAPMLSIDDETCIECGICVDLLPQYFEIVEGEVRVRRDFLRSGQEPDAAAIDEAARDCPGNSIRH